MKNKQILLIIGLTLLLFSSCKETNSSNSESDKNLSIALSEIKTLGDFRKVEYQFIGNPSNDSKENPTSTIKLELFDTNKTEVDNESFGKQCAKKIFKASKKTKGFSKIWVSFVNTGKNKTVGDDKKVTLGINLSITKEVINFVYSTSDL